MSATIDLQLFPWKVFHGGDDIHGKVKIHIISSLNVQNVQVKLIGLSQTRYVKHRGQYSIPYNEHHDLVYDVLTLFPPCDLDDSLQAKSYTLPEGKTLESSFHFKLPFMAHCGDPSSRATSNLNNSIREQEKLKHDPIDRDFPHIHSAILPPTFREKNYMAGSNAEVKYLLKVTIRRPNPVLANIRQEFPIRVSIPPPDPFPADDEVMVSSDMLSITKNNDGKPHNPIKSMFKSSDAKKLLHFRIVMFRPRFTVAGQTVKMRVLLLSDMEPSQLEGVGTFFLKGYEVRIENRTDYRAVSTNSYFEDSVILGSGKNVHTIDMSKMIPTEQISRHWMLESFFMKYSLDITDFFEPFVFAKELTPTFEICNIQHKHLLKLKIRLGESGEVWGTTKANLDHNCVIVGGFPRAEAKEELPEYEKGDFKDPLDEKREDKRVTLM